MDVRQIVSPVTGDREIIPLHPFGKSTLNSTGEQYSTEVSGIGDAYTEIEKVTIVKPAGKVIEELELGLIGAVKSSAAAEGVNYKWQGSDDGTSWEDLCAEQTRAADASLYADTTPMNGRFAFTGNFLGTGSSFQLRMVVKSAVAAGETASGKTKSSSYVNLICRR